MTSVVNYDTGWDARWDDMKRYGPYSRHVRAWIHRLIAPLTFTSVLDVGCGQGELLAEIRARYPHVQQVAGVDFSPVSVEMTRKRLGDGHFEALDLQTQRLGTQYDLTISSDVMEHILDDMAALRNMAAMTRHYALVSSIQGNDLPQWEVDSVGHVRNYRRGELAAKMRAAGFEVMREVEWGFPFYSPLYRTVLRFGGGQGTDGAYGWRRKLLAQGLYQLFRLNTTWRGALVLVLARPQRPSQP